MANSYKVIYILIIFILSLHTVEGAKIQSLQLHHQEMVSKEGQRLRIPCSFITDDPKTEHKIQLEWSVMPKGSSSFTPIIRLDDAEFLPINHPNTRASIDLKGVHEGHCSLVIDPVKATDSGIYQVRIGLNNQETEGTRKKIKLQVQQRHRKRSQNTRTSQPSDDMEDEPASEADDPDTMMIARVVQSLKNTGALQYFVIGGWVLLVLLILGSIVAIFCVLRYRRMRGKINDNLSWLWSDDEGLSNQSEKSEVSSTTDMDTPYESDEETDSPVTERHITSEMRGKEKPKQPDVKLRIDHPTAGQSSKTKDQSSGQHIKPLKIGGQHPKERIQSMKIGDQHPKGKNQSLKIGDQHPKEKIQSMKAEGQSAKAGIKPHFSNLMTEEHKEKAKKLHVTIQVEEPETADPSYATRKTKAKRPGDTKVEDLHFSQFLGVRWSYNWGKYWIAYPKSWRSWK